MFKGDPSQELFSSFPVIFQISYDISNFLLFIRMIDIQGRRKFWKSGGGEVL